MSVASKPSPMMAIDPQPTGAFEWTQEPWGCALRCRSLPARHLFTSRDLVLREDEHEWDAVAASLGVARERLLLIRQVHGADVAVARRGAGGAWTRPQADILVSDDPDVAIAVRVADCAPLLLIDTVSGAAAAVHAGWRGTAQNAARASLAARLIAEAIGRIRDCLQRRQRLLRVRGEDPLRHGGRLIGASNNLRVSTESGDVASARDAEAFSRPRYSRFSNCKS